MRRTTTKKVIAIFTQKLAGYLMQRGFVLIDVKPNRNNPHRNDFLFGDSPELQKAIREYTSIDN